MHLFSKQLFSTYYIWHRAGNWASKDDKAWILVEKQVNRTNSPHVRTSAKRRDGPHGMVERADVGARKTQLQNLTEPLLSSASSSGNVEKMASFLCC